MKAASRDLLEKSLSFILPRVIPALPPEVHAHALEKLSAYTDFLLAYNEKVNVVGPVDEETFITKHLADSLAALPLLPRTGKLADIGSGGGLPGIPLSLFWDGPVTLVESKQKKAKFLEETSRHLGLTNLKVLCRNAAEVRGTFDVMVSRAFSDISHTLKLCTHLLGKDSVFFFYKGTREVIEKELLGFSDKNYTILPLTVPFLQAPRHMIKWKR